MFLAETGWDQRWPDEPPPALTTSVRLGLGQLLLAPVGSLWRDGQLVQPTTRPRRRVEVVSASTTWPTRELGPTTAHQNALGVPWIPAYPIPAGTGLPLFRVVTADGGALWVPALELARATFGPTSEWLRLMIEGGMYVFPDLRRRIVDPDRSGRSANTPKNLNLHAYRRLDDIDVLVAARIGADQRLRRCFDAVANSLRTQRFGRDPAHVRMPFPFERPSVWSIEECWVAVQKPNGGVASLRLLTHISSIEYDLGIDSVRVFYPGKNAADDEAQQAGAEPSGIRIRARAKLGEQIEVVTNLASWSAFGLMKRETSDQQTLGGWAIEHIPIKTEEALTGKTMPVPLEAPVREATTADKGTKFERGDRVAIKLNVKDRVLPMADIARPPLTRMASTLTALQTLSNDQQRELQIVLPTIGLGVDPIDRLWRYPLNDGERPLRWAMTRDGRPRRALVARMASSRGWIYALEAEHIEIVVDDPTIVDKGAGPVVEQDGYSALCLMEIRGPDPLSADTIGDLLRLHASYRGVWSRNRLAIPMTRVVRSAAWLKDPAAYSRAIGRAVARLEGQDAGGLSADLI